MTADIHPLPSGSGTASESPVGGEDAAYVPIDSQRSVYLDAYLAPFQR